MANREKSIQELIAEKAANPEPREISIDSIPETNLT